MLAMAAGNSRRDAIVRALIGHFLLALFAMLASSNVSSEPLDAKLRLRNLYGDQVDSWPLEAIEVFGRISAESIGVPFVRLLASPDKFDGRAVTVVGVFGVGHEEFSLYLDKKSFDQMIVENSIPMQSDLLRMDESLLSKAHGKYVRFTGVFKADFPTNRRWGPGNGVLVDVLPIHFGSFLPTR